MGIKVGDYIVYTKSFFTIKKDNYYSIVKVGTKGVFIKTKESRVIYTGFKSINTDHCTHYPKELIETKIGRILW